MLPPMRMQWTRRRKSRAVAPIQTVFVVEVVMATPGLLNIESPVDAMPARRFSFRAKRQAASTATSLNFPFSIAIKLIGCVSWLPQVRTAAQISESDVSTPTGAGGLLVATIRSP